MKGKKGFTLIELVVVIAVLGILAGIAIPRFLDAQASAKGAKVIANLRTIDSAVDVYHAKTGRYPTSIEELYVDSSTGPSYKLLERLSDYKDGKFIITNTAGKELSYEDEGEYMVTADGRGALGAAKHTVDYYLAGGTMIANMPTIGDMLLNLKSPTGQSFNSDMDSAAAAIEGSLASQFVAALKEQGLDLAALGAVSWNYNGKTLSWTNVDVTTVPAGTTVVGMAYNLNTNNEYQGMYSIWNYNVKSLTSKLSSGPATYNVLDFATRKETVESKGASAEDKKDASTMLALYDKIVAGS